MYGFMLTALGAFIFVPAALARQFEIFLIGLFSIRHRPGYFADSRQSLCHHYRSDR